MTWSYDVALSNPKDQVRLLIGDTDDSATLLADEEIEYYLSVEASTRMAASRAAMALAAKYTRKSTKAVGDLKISYSDVSKKFFDLSVELKTNGMLHQIPSAGGITVSDSRVNESDSALRHNAIKRGLTDYTKSPTAPNVEGS